MLNHWEDIKPPIDTYVMASYGVMDELKLVKTCRRGCCIYSDGFSMLLPRYWRLATENEIEKEKLRQHHMVDYSSLY